MNERRDDFELMTTENRKLPHGSPATDRLVQRPNTLFMICVLMVTTIVIAGLWPFNFLPSNGVHWLTEENGIKFREYGIAYSRDDLLASSVNSTAESFRPITIEIWAKPYEEPVNYIPCVVALSHDVPEAPLLTIGQWESFLEVRTPRKIGQAGDEFDEIGVRDALRSGEQRFVTLTAGAGGTIIYLDGARAAGFPSHRLLPGSSGKMSFQIILGNDTTGKSPWHGEVLGLAIYERELRPEEVGLHYAYWRQQKYSAITGEPGVVGVYLLDEGSGPWVHNRAGSSGHLWIPEMFRPLKSALLTTPGQGFKITWYVVQDVATNIFGFVPLGYFLMGFLLAVPRRSRLQPTWVGVLVVVIGTGLSLLVEILQVYLPTRDSSLVDVISNTTGTALGVLLFHLTSGRWVSGQDGARG